MHPFSLRNNNRNSILCQGDNLRNTRMQVDLAGLPLSLPIIKLPITSTSIRKKKQRAIVIRSPFHHFFTILGGTIIDELSAVWIHEMHSLRIRISEKRLWFEIVTKPASVCLPKWLDIPSRLESCATTIAISSRSVGNNTGIHDEGGGRHAVSATDVIRNASSDDSGRIGNGDSAAELLTDSS